MKSVKKIFALILVAAMVLALLAACAKTEKQPAEQDKPAQTETPAPETPAETETPETPTEPEAPAEPETPAEPAQPETPAAPAEPEEEDEPEEIADIEVWLMGGVSQEDLETVQAAINEITEEKLRVHVNFTILTGMDYPTGLSMAIAGGETVDVCNICPLASGTFDVMRSSGQLMDIAPLLETEGRELKQLVEKYLGPFSVGDAIYGVPTIRNMNSSAYYVCRKDVLEELGTLEALENAKSFSDLQEVFQVVVDQTSYYIAGSQNNFMFCGGFQLGPDKFEDCYPYAKLDTLTAIEADDQGNLKNLYTTDLFVQFLERVADWNARGFVYPDSLMTQEVAATLIKNGMQIGMFVTGELGIEANQSSRTGFPMTAVKMVDGVLGAGAIISWGAGVPVTADEPEAAIRFLNYLYQDAELMNMLAWGVEGKHWENDGGVAKYANGTDAGSTVYHFGEIFGNSFLLLPWDNTPDFRERAKAANDAAEMSYYISMSFDTSEMNDLIAGLSAVQAEYINPFNCGLYTEAAYNEFLQKMEAAGIDDYVAAYQAQVDAQR